MKNMNNTYSFLPGEDVNITCKIPDSSVVWTSNMFDAFGLVNNVKMTETRLVNDEAIIFSLIDVEVSPTCATTTATIANIRESMQGLSLTCTDGLNFEATIVIDIIGK